MTTYRYLYGYFLVVNGSQEIASGIYERSKPILTSADVKDAEEGVRMACNADKVLLLSFSELKGVE